MLDETVNPARLAAKTAGATVVNLDDYRTNSAIAGNASASSPYIAPRLMLLFIIIAFAFVVLAFIKR